MRFPGIETNILKFRVLARFYVLNLASRKHKATETQVIHDSVFTKRQPGTGLHTKIMEESNLIKDRVLS